jgi:L-2-hydroxyglutarate oxidase
MTESFDVTIVGGGIVGLATALRLQQRRPAAEDAILEKEPELATHQTGITAGSFMPGCTTSRLTQGALCRDGKTQMEGLRGGA